MSVNLQCAYITTRYIFFNPPYIINSVSKLVCAFYTLCHHIMGPPTFVEGICPVSSDPPLIELNTVRYAISSQECLIHTEHVFTFNCTTCSTFVVVSRTRTSSKRFLKNAFCGNSAILFLLLCCCWSIQGTSCKGTKLFLGKGVRSSNSLHLKINTQKQCCFPSTQKGAFRPFIINYLWGILSWNFKG